MELSRKTTLLHLGASVCSSIALLLLSGCDPVTLTLGGAAITGTNMVGNQEGMSGSLSDLSLHTKINKEFFSRDKDLFDRVELSIKHGNVVVIGYLKSEEQCRKAVEIAQKFAGIEHVFDETSIQPPPTARDLAIDSSITSRVKSSLTFNGNVQSLNYDVTTVKGIVYICGTAQSPFERNIVINCARETSGVVKVVAYIFINKHGRINNTNGAKVSNHATPKNNSAKKEIKVIV